MLTGRGVTVFVAGLAMWVVARIVGSPGMEVVGVGLAALPFLAALLARRRRSRIATRRRLSDIRVVPGTRVTVTLDIENRSPSPTSVHRCLGICPRLCEITAFAASRIVCVER